MHPCEIKMIMYSCWCWVSRTIHRRINVRLCGAFFSNGGGSLSMSRWTEFYSFNYIWSWLSYLVSLWFIFLIYKVNDSDLMIFKALLTLKMFWIFANAFYLESLQESYSIPEEKLITGSPWPCKLRPDQEIWTWWERPGLWKAQIT